MEQEVYQGLMNKIGLTAKQKNNILSECLKEANIKKQRKGNIGGQWAGLAAALVILAVVIVLGAFSPSTQQQGIPLVVSVYAEGVNGEKLYTTLELNKKVKLYPAVSSYDDEFTGFAFDMTLLPGMHVALAVVDKDGRVLTNEEACGEEYDKIRWAMTGGDDISYIMPYRDESVPEEYKNGTDLPKKKGKSVIWIPNEEGNNYVRLGCYNAEFERVVTFYLEMSEENGDYYAEIIRMN